MVWSLSILLYTHACYLQRFLLNFVSKLGSARMAQA